jgi:hypothetical protein
VARRARQDVARSVLVRQARQGPFGRGVAQSGWVGHGRGPARRRMARRNMAWQARRDCMWFGEVRRDGARPGTAE